MHKNSAGESLVGVDNEDGLVEGRTVRRSAVQELVPVEVVRQLTRRRGRRALGLPSQLVRSQAASGQLTWAWLREAALARSKAIPPDGPPSRLLNRVRRLEGALAGLEGEREGLRRRLGQLSRENQLLRATQDQHAALHAKILSQERERRHTKTQTYARDFVYETERLTKLLTEVEQLKELYLKQKLLTGSMCEKYVRLREGKERLRRRVRRLEEGFGRALEEALRDFDRDRAAFAGRGVRRGDLALRCATLSFNNAALQLALLRAQARRAVAAEDLPQDVSTFSVLKDTQALARLEAGIRKPERFVRLELEDGEVPLFELEEDELEESERADCSLYSKSETSDLGYSSARLSELSLGKTVRSESALHLASPDIGQ